MVRNLVHAIPVALVASGLAGCGHSITGTVSCRYIDAADATVLDVRSAGVAFVDMAYDRGVLLGWSERTYLYPKSVKAERETSWGICNGLPGQEPVVADSRTIGLELSASEPVTGLSLGYNSTFMRMPVRAGRSLRLSYRYVRGRPEQSEATLCEGDQCGALPFSASAPER
tara:strand:- start:1603 stop:2115 length:513 start_codon:yes stop_codon:yes gene_type:complete